MANERIRQRCLGCVALVVIPVLFHGCEKPSVPFQQSVWQRSLTRRHLMIPELRSKYLSTESTEADVVALLGKPSRRLDPKEVASSDPGVKWYLYYELDFVNMAEAFDSAYFIVAISPDGQYMRSWVFIN